MSYGSIEGADAPIRSLHQFLSVTLENKGSVARDHVRCAISVPTR